MKEIFNAFLRAYDRRHIISIRGCSNCSDFWYFLLTHLVFQLLLYMVYMTVMFLQSDGLIETLASIDEIEWGIGSVIGAVLFFAYTIFMLFSLIPATTLTVRRYHDAGMSGKIALAFLALSICCMGYLGKTLVEFFSYYQDMIMGTRGGATLYDPSGMSILGPILVIELVFLAHLLILASPTGTFGTKYLQRKEPVEL